MTALCGLSEHIKNRNCNSSGTRNPSGSYKLQLASAALIVLYHQLPNNSRRPGASGRRGIHDAGPAQQPGPHSFTLLHSFTIYVIYSSGTELSIMLHSAAGS